MPFAGKNHLFLHENKLFLLLPSLTGKKKDKKKESVCNFFAFFLIFYPFVTKKDGKICYSIEKNDFDQQTACRAPNSG